MKKVNPTGPKEGSYRVIRGGSWFNDAQYLRSAYRDYDSPGFRNYNLGFRLQRTTNTFHSSNLTLDKNRIALAIAKAQDAFDELKELLK